MLARGLSWKDLINLERWWHGPEWLTFQENNWPQVNELKYVSTDKEIESEYKSKVIVSSAIVREKIIDIGSFSNLKKLLRVTV